MMDPQTKRALGEHVAQRWTQRDGGCPMCGGSRWDAHGYAIVMLSRSPTHEDMGPAPQGFPAAAMTCVGCGFVALLNMQRAGLAPQ